MENSLFSATPYDATHGLGYLYSLQYHIVWCTKYRKKIFVHGLGKETAEYLKETAAALQMDIVAMEIMPDHIHILADCKPQLRLSDAIKVLKGNTSRWLFMSHPELKKGSYGADTFGILPILLLRSATAARTKSQRIFKTKKPNDSG